MNSRQIFKSAADRPLYIDFDAYTDGDETFKKELIALMVDNLRELQESLKEVAKCTNARLFHQVCHKIKATIQMLDDQEFSDTIEKLKVMVTDASLLGVLDGLCTQLIESLQNVSGKAA